MKKIKNNLKNFEFEKRGDLTFQVWNFLPQTCDICGSDENPADPFLKCGYGWEDDEDDFCDNIICRQCRVEDQEDKRVICKWCL